jgi:hypothetical protein
MTYDLTFFFIMQGDVAELLVTKQEEIPQALQTDPTPSCTNGY